VDVIERNARAQCKLVEDMLDVSRVTTGKMRLKSQPTDLGSVVQAAIDTVRPAADAKQITLDCNGSAGSIKMVGDPDRLQQVVWNLLSNATKFTQPGGRVVVRTDSSDGRRGSPSPTTARHQRKFLPHVFDRFRQADASSTRSHGGLGIGLTIVRHIVELHGGRVQASSPGVRPGRNLHRRASHHRRQDRSDAAGPALVAEPELSSATMQAQHRSPGRAGSGG
jgi:signal transduction histidine kinase